MKTKNETTIVTDMVLFGVLGFMAYTAYHLFSKKQTKSPVEMTVEELKEVMQKYIEIEDYKNAAKIRDIINEKKFKQLIS